MSKITKQNHHKCFCHPELHRSVLSEVNQNQTESTDFGHSVTEIIV